MSKQLSWSLAEAAQEAWIEQGKSPQVLLMASHMAFWQPLLPVTGFPIENWEKKCDHRTELPTFIGETGKVCEWPGSEGGLSNLSSAVQAQSNGRAHVAAPQKWLTLSSASTQGNGCWRNKFNLSTPSI